MLSLSREEIEAMGLTALLYLCRQLGLSTYGIDTIPKARMKIYNDAVVS